MFTFIKNAIAAIQKRREEEEAARKFKAICTTILVGVALLCVGYFVISCSKLFSKETA